ncbi:hypothetical protein EVB97_354 [Rhizobium phage RHph_Y65]|uniref:Uncharacterized protein n=1 Tax=Rhizobium phage RHph_Y65 TaxID=2509785 RepID=A0A7S5R8C9_9CAUD|nr:hypothetical protein PQC17_gp307 [Rhizobium phage RHph_Y65]QIG72892.1 hypothetical protein EVB97_354 [Rhizobium phage RHph_Y65]
MSNNYNVVDASGNMKTFRSIETGGIHVHQHVPSTPDGVPVSETNPLNVTIGENELIRTKANLTSWIDYSRAINTTNPMVVDTNFNRSGLTFQNLSQQNVMAINFDSPATLGAGSIILPPYALYEMPSYMINPGKMYVYGTTGDQFTCKESNLTILYTPTSLSFDGSSSFTAVAGQSTFNGSFLNKIVMVWVNGMKIVAGTDYVIEATLITFTPALTLGDVVDVVVFSEST